MTPADIHAHRILILDFGSQYTQLIARRVRELGVYCEIHPWDMGDAVVTAFNPKGIILSGGPESVLQPNAPAAPQAVWSAGVPVLGICYGMQTMAAQLGGKVEMGIVHEFGALFGLSAFQCPYCDGWEFRDQAVAVYGQRKRGLEMARAMTAWTGDILLCTDGPSRYTAEQREHLRRNEVRLVEQPIHHLEGVDGRLRAVVFRDGTRVEREALFFDTPARGQSGLTEQLGCRFNQAGGVLCGKYEATSVPGLYVAGNIIRNVQLSIVAAAEGANAAFGINRALTREDFERRAIGTNRIEHTAP